MKIQDLRHIRLTETYFEDLPDEERTRLRSQNQAELRRLSKRDYPFKLKDGTEVLGPVIRFEPYKSDAGRDETWKDSNQQMVERPNGERAIMFAVGLGLITKTPPRKPLNWPGMLGLKEQAAPDVQEWEGKNLAWTDGHFFWITVNKPHDATYIAAWNKDNKQIGRLSTSEFASGQKGKWLSISDVSVKEEALEQRLATRMYKVLLQHMGKQYDGLLGYKPDIVDKRIHRIYKRLGAKDYPDWYTIPNPNKPGEVNEQQYLKGFEIFTLKRGTTVYHGTDSEDFDERADELQTPFWVSDSPEVAKYFGTGYQGGNKPRLLTYTMTDDVNLIVIHDSEDMNEIEELAGSGGDPRELADFVCFRLGYGGWIIPDNYPEGADIMLCHTDIQLQDVTAIEQ